MTMDGIITETIIGRYIEGNCLEKLLNNPKSSIKGKISRKLPLNFIGTTTSDFY